MRKNTSKSKRSDGSGFTFYKMIKKATSSSTDYIAVYLANLYV